MNRKNQASDVDRQIDENLKRVYEDHRQEELPASFLDLIKTLKSKSAEASDER